MFLISCLLFSMMFILFGKLKFKIFCSCLDGSPPTYHFEKVFGSGINNWLVAFEVCPCLQISINN
ncbi:hypothetical protein GLYMA_04G142901v4 [Glycine max]|nr:hypothetical protein GLYMA_04G142901v4 [Glycine max]KAH1111334.1 hypothetical protein GYH30_009918 [Glycine max]